MKKLLKLLLPTLVVFSCLIGTTYAWFSQELSLNLNDLEGQIFAGYFYAGEGTEENPYIITRPAHFYNMMNLCNNKDGFNEKHYKLGYDLDGDGDLEVFNYNDEGQKQDGYSDVLNMASVIDLYPIGSDSSPFYGSFDGSGLTVSNITISDKAVCDLGIFGYVDYDATIENCYFENVSLDIGSMEDDDGSSSEHTAHEGLAYVGYLAGHVENCNSFTEVYINNCETTGTASNTEVDNNWGYFGCCDNAAEISEWVYKKTDDYSFTLDPESVYDMFDGLDLTSTMTTRNTAYTASGTLATAITDNSTYYTLKGRMPGTTGSGVTNYSISTLGYTGRVPIYEDYEVYYNSNSHVPSSASITDVAPENSTETGDFIYNDGSSYIYYNCTEASSVNFYSVTISTEGTTYSSSSSISNFSSFTEATLYVDNVGVQTVSTTATKSGRKITIPAISFSPVSLQEGIHYIGILYTSNFSYRSGRSNYYVRCFSGALNGSTVKGNKVDVTSDQELSFDLTLESSNSNTNYTYSETEKPDTKSGTLAVYTAYDLYYGDGIQLTQQPSLNAGKWIVQIDTGRTEEGSAYLADLLAYSGYNATNVDVVGGIKFYEDRIHLEGFGNDTSSATLGDHFYSTSQTSDGIVMYIKNTGTDNMGSVDFYYKPTDNNAVPQFNKGSSEYVSFSTAGASTDTNSSYTSIAGNVSSCYKSSLGITKDNIHKYCYCGINAEGTIISTYTTSGSATYLDGYLETDVKYFVVLLGLSNGQADVYGIHLEYKADDGSGGEYEAIAPFGSIEYRTTPETISSSVLIFNYYNTTGDSYGVKVNYSNLVYTVTVSSGTAFEFAIVQEGYTINVNGTEYTRIGIYDLTL